MKKLKRWIALILAVVLVVSNAVYSMGSALQADVIDGAEPAVVSQSAPEPVNEAKGLDVAVVEPTPAPEATPQPEPTPEPEQSVVQQPAVQEPDAEVTVEEKPEEIKYNIVIQKPDADGGAMKAWTTGEKADVTYDGENQYKEEITEGTPFNFEITAHENYEVEKVTDQNGTEIASKTVDGKVYTYEMLNVTEEKVVSILYKEVTKSEKPEAEEPKAEEENEVQKSTKAAAETKTIHAGRRRNHRRNI